MGQMVCRLTVVLIEIPLRVTLAVLDGLSESAVWHRFTDVAVDGLSRVVTRVLRTPTVEAAIADSVMQGMNAFLQQPDLDQHIRIMASTMSKTQPDLARQQGEDFPVIVGSFLQGMIRGVGGKSPKRPNNSTTTATATEHQPHGEDPAAAVPATPIKRSNSVHSTNDSLTPPLQEDANPLPRIVHVDHDGSAVATSSSVESNSSENNKKDV